MESRVKVARWASLRAVLKGESITAKISDVKFPADGDADRFDDLFNRAKKMYNWIVALLETRLGTSIEITGLGDNKVFVKISSRCKEVSETVEGVTFDVQAMKIVETMFKVESGYEVVYYENAGDSTGCLSTGLRRVCGPFFKLVMIPMSTAELLINIAV